MVEQVNPARLKENKDNKVFEKILKSLEALNKGLDKQKEMKKQIFERFKKLKTNINKAVKKQK